MKKLLVIAGIVLGALMLMPSAHAAHTATLTGANTTCNSTQTCTAQLYRATGTCPASGIGTLTYTELTSTLAASASTTTSQNWSYTDSTVVDGQTYCYYMTNTYTAGGPPSAASATFQLIIPISAPGIPTLSGVVN